MVTGTRRIKFPEPGATKEKELVTMIGKDRMCVHFDQDHPALKNPTTRITPKVIEHTVALAIAAGWAGAAVAKDAVTGHTSGMMLLREKRTTVTSEATDVTPKAIAAPKRK